MKWIGMAAAVLTGLVVGKSEEVFADNVDEKALEEETANQRTEIEQLLTDLEKEEAEVMKISNTIADNTATKEKLQQKIDTKEAELSEKGIELDKKVAIYEENIAIAKDRMLSLQVKDGNMTDNVINVLLDSQNLPDLLSRAYNVGVLLESHNEFMRNIEKERVQIEKEKSVLEQEKAAVEQDKSKVENLLAEMEKDKKDVEKGIEELNKRRESIEKDYEANTSLLAEIEASRVKYAHELEVFLQEKEERNATLRSISGTSLNILESKESGVANGNNSSTASSNQIAQTVIEKAHSYLGVPYVWGGATPSGFDCSGLVQYVFNDVGISLPRVANQQESAGEPISFTDLEPGDLLHFGAKGSTYHIGIYIGGGEFIHAPKPGDVVKVTKLSHFMPDFATRVIPREEQNNEVSASQVKTESAGTFEITHYSSVNGRTRMGTSMANQNIQTKDGYRIIAVDPNVIPLGTIMRITTNQGETFLGQADDTGGAIKGRIIDIAVKSHAEAIQLGRGAAKVEIVQ